MLKALAGLAAPGSHVCGVAETPSWLRHGDAPAPCSRTHRTPLPDPAKTFSTLQPVADGAKRPTYPSGRPC
ncbi:hypothetical protein JCM13580A_54640 [Streptomyces drozdowiczii]